MASYNSRGEDMKRRAQPRATLGKALNDMRFFLSSNAVHPEDHDELLRKVRMAGHACLNEHVLLTCDRW